MEFNDERRLKVLADYRVLDTPPEPVFDNITRLSALIFQTPIALVSLVDKDRQWFKSRFGIEAPETSRDIAFCDHAIRSNETMVVEDATTDARFRANPLVTGTPFVRFYCGVPLRSPEGEGLGTLCLIDRAPRTLSPREREGLEGLARQVESELEIRRRLLLLEEAMGTQRTQQRARELLASMVVHDLRGPLTAITLIAASLRSSDPEIQRSVEDLNHEADRARGMLTDILDVCLQGLGRLRLRRAHFDVHALARETARRAKRRAQVRNQVFKLEVPATPALIDADPELIGRVLENLINNAMTHGPPDQPITIASRAEAAGVRIEVRDRGQPLGEPERNGLFAAMETPGEPRPGERGLGLGLNFCAIAIHAHGGAVGVDLAPEGGNSFFFQVPALKPAHH